MTRLKLYHQRDEDAPPADAGASQFWTCIDSVKLTVGDRETLKLNNWLCHRVHQCSPAATPQAASTHRRPTGSNITENEHI